MTSNTSPAAHNPVNEHPWLTHKMVDDAIRSGSSADLLTYAREAEKAEAGKLAEQLRVCASDRAEHELELAAAKLNATPDAETITVYGLPVETIDALLTARGFEVEFAGEGYGDGPRTFYCVRTPNGQKLWHRSEALTLALIAEATR